VTNASKLTCARLDSGVYATLGGLRVWAPSSRVLRAGLDEFQLGIETALIEHSSLDKVGVLFALGQLMGARINKRVVGAVLGRELRLGRVEEILCSATTNKVFRVYVGARALPCFAERLRVAREHLRRESHVRIKELRDQFFEPKPGTWTQTAHLAGRMVFDGTAIYVDKYQIAWPSGLERAFR